MILSENDYQILKLTDAFHFTNTLRAKKHKSGLDYSKIVIIEKSEYIDSTDAIIDKDEFNETMVNLGRIKKES
ncbi:MAG: hypothetical protein PUD13_03505 [Lachnospira sp.]|nr:hypothetical protein [Lachnospira sp.]